MVSSRPLLFTASLLLQYFLPPGTTFDLILRVVILVTLFAAAYIAEVIRGGLAALPRGQYEAADALGLDYWQAQRLIIMPQALMVALRPYGNEIILMVKGTSLASIITLMEVTGIAQGLISQSYRAIEVFIAAGAIYLFINFLIVRALAYLEIRMTPYRSHG